MKVNLKSLTEEEQLYKELQSVHFNIHFNKSRQYEPIVKSLLNSYGGKYEREVRSIVTNTARMIKSRGTHLRIPRNDRPYTNNTQRISVVRIKELLDLLEVDGLVNIFIGGVKEYSFGDAQQFQTSLVEILPKFTEKFTGVNLNLVGVKESSMIEIKQRGTKKPMNTQGVKGVKEKKERVELFNTALIESRISLKGIDLPDQNYKRVFIDNLKTGGRWYNSVGGIQTMEKSLRPFLQIDGEDLVELDYSAIHPNICYQNIDAELPEGFDPYGVDIWEDHIDPEDVSQFKIRHGVTQYNPARNLIKMATMIGLNCSDLRQASRALSQQLGQDRIKWGTGEECKAKYFGVRDIDCKELLIKVQEHNNLIKDSFFSDAGVTLQFIDSELMDSIICEVLAINEILLPWHDGLMVKRQIAGKVRGFMYKAWYKQFGSIRFCKVEEK